MNQEHFYHIYPLGFTGSNQASNDGVMVTSIHAIKEQIPHLTDLNITTVLFGPIFQSETHGYDTIDYLKVDERLGTNDMLIQLVQELHDQGIKVMVDCVFNHVSRSHFAFLDLKKNGMHSKYVNWFMDVDFSRSNSYGDGFTYGSWDGHTHLVKLNLDHREVRDYLIEVAREWQRVFHIDGLRMDAADVMSLAFLKELSDTMHGIQSDFMMLGEVVHGDYNRWLDLGGLDAITNYETYKGLYSSLNDDNYFEVAYALNRQFGGQGAYHQKAMFNFVDNHDVNRVASRLQNKGHLYPLYIMLYTMPGIPSLYYGSEFALEGVKGNGTDAPLRPSWGHIAQHRNHPLKDTIQKLSELRKSSDALKNGSYEQIHISPKTIGYKREIKGERTFVFINSNEAATTIGVKELNGYYLDLLNNETIHCQGQVSLYGQWGRILLKK